MWCRTSVVTGGLANSGGCLICCDDGTAYRCALAKHLRSSAVAGRSFPDGSAAAYDGIQPAACHPMRSVRLKIVNASPSAPITN